MGEIPSIGSRFWWVDLSMATPMTAKRAKAVRLLLLALSVASAVFLVTVGSVAQQPAFQPRLEEPEEYPDLPGREETFYFCVACHNFKLVAQQGMSRHRWDGTLNFMTERHGMPKLEGKERETILDYLEKAFPESEAPTGWQNPFLKR